MERDAKRNGEEGALPYSVTRPLNLRSFLRPLPPVRVDALPFVDLILIGLFFAAGTSRFLFAPGAEVDLPRVEAGLLGGVGATAVLTAGANNLFFFEGMKIDGESLPRVLGDFVRARGGDERLLLKVDHTTPLAEVFEILETARRAGFVSVQLAADERRADLQGLRQAGGR